MKGNFIHKVNWLTKDPAQMAWKNKEEWKKDEEKKEQKQRLMLDKTTSLQ